MKTATDRWVPRRSNRAIIHLLLRRPLREQVQAVSDERPGPHVSISFRAELLQVEISCGAPVFHLERLAFDGVRTLRDDCLEDGALARRKAGEPVLPELVPDRERFEIWAPGDQPCLGRLNRLPLTRDERWCRPSLRYHAPDSRRRDPPRETIRRRTGRHSRDA